MEIPDEPTPPISPSANRTLLDQLSMLLAQHNLLLSETAESYLLDNMDIVFNLNNHLLSYPDQAELVHWGIQEMTKREITWNQFQNWFTGGDIEAEYMALINDPEFWKSATFPPAKLPSLFDFESNFPKRSEVSILALADSIGGDAGVLIKRIYSENPQFNSCAVRHSYALIKSGIEIPYIADPKGGNRDITIKGDDDNYYFLRADEMDIWMQLAFGTNDGKARFLNRNLNKVEERTTRKNSDHYQYVKPDSLKNKMIPSTITKKIIGFNGIYSMVVEDSRAFQATGHVDFINDNLADGEFYFRTYNKIFNIWQLK